MSNCAGITTKLRSLMLTLIIVLLFSNPVLAETNWQPIGPFGGSVRTIAIDPADSQSLYAGTFGGGLFKSSNGGAAWEPANNGMANTNVLTVAIDPADSQIVYAGTYGGGLFKSADGGEAWIAANSGMTSTDIYSLAIDQINTQTVYAGTPGGVFKSTNGGATWTVLNSGMTDIYVIVIAIDPTNSQTIYAGTLGGVFKSTNGGTAWEAVNSGMTNTVVYSIAIDPNNSQSVYVGTDGGGVFKSTNGGASWAAVNNGMPYGTVDSLAINPTNSQIVYAGTSGGVFKSTNGGTSWAAANNGFTGTNVRSIAIDPSNSQTVYVGTFAGLVKTINSGASWATVNSGMTNTKVFSLATDPTNSQTVYAGTDGGGLFKSTNGGASWETVNNGMTNTTVYSLAIDPTNSQTVYAGTDGIFYRSTDGGASWTAANNGIPYTSVRAITIDPTNSQILYAGLPAGVYKSINGSASWELVNSDMTSTFVYSIAIDPTSSQTVYAGTDGELFKTTNGGALWSAVNIGISYTSVYSLAIDPTNSRTVYAGTSAGVLKSTNGGTSWASANNGMTSTIVYSIAIDPTSSQTVIVGTDAGHFKSTNGGTSWSAANSANMSKWIPALTIDPTGNQTIYVGTYGSGIYKTISSISPTVSAPASAFFNIGTAGSLKVTASGWPAPTLSVSGTIPNGLTFNPVTGILNGTPQIGSAGPYTLLFTADNGLPPAASRAVTVSVLASSDFSVTITNPVNNSNLTTLTSISGTASGSGLSSVKVQVTDGTYYLQSNGSFDTNPAWISASGTTSWSLNTTSVAWVEGITYTISAQANSVKTATASFRIQPSAAKQPTVLTAAFAPDSIKAGDSTAISGSLLKTDTTVLEGQTIKVIITPPSTQAIPDPPPIITTYITDAGGNFDSGLLTSFNSSGVYMVQVRFEGNSSYQASSQSFSLPVVAQSGYAVIVVGKANNNSLLDLHTATATNIYSNLITKRGFLDANIIPVISTTNTAKTKSDISTALATIKAKYTTVPAPVYMIMIDHGSQGAQGGFVMGGETLLPSELGSMLDTFESGIDTNTLTANKRFLIVGTCYSGLFQSISKPGRVIITSSADTEQSLAGSVSYSGNTPTLSGGDYFIDNLFSFLGRGDSFRNAFTLARTAVALRDPRTVPLGLHSGVVDPLAQHPLLDDNGDSTPSYDLEGAIDGIASSTLYLGEGMRVPAGGNPTDITATLPKTILDSALSTHTIWMTVNDSSRVDRAWIEIRTPGTTASSNGTGQVIPSGLDTMPLIFDGQKWVGDYSTFTTAGKYDIYYYTRDIRTGNTSPMAHTVVYKKIANNPVQPSAFALTSPVDDAQVNPPVLFTWQESVDSNGLTYTLLVATDQNFSNVIYQEDNIPAAATIANDNSFKNPASPGSYYCQNNSSWCWWKIQAIDGYGEVTESDSRSFTIVKTNALAIMIKAFVTSAGSPVKDASCSVTNGNSVTSLSTGLCLMTTPQMPATATFSAVGYATQSTISVPDPVDNVSRMPVALIPVIATHTLSLTIDGSGIGLVNCIKGLETVACNGIFNSTDSVTVHATPDWKSLPVVWGGDCSGSSAPDCTLTMTTGKSASATFNANNQARVNAMDYMSLNDAYSDILTVTGNTIKAKTDYVFYENLLLDQNKTVTIDGGYSDLSGTRGDGSTIIKGTGDYTLSIKKGMLKVKGVIVR